MTDELKDVTSLVNFCDDKGIELSYLRKIIKNFPITTFKYKGETYAKLSDLNESYNKEIKASNYIQSLKKPTKGINQNNSLSLSLKPLSRSDQDRIDLEQLEFEKRIINISTISEYEELLKDIEINQIIPKEIKQNLTKKLFKPS